MKLKLKFEHNDKVRDVNTGYFGRVKRVNYDFDTSSLEYCVESIDSTGRPVEWWVPEQNLETFYVDKAISEAIEGACSLIGKLDEYL